MMHSGLAEALASQLPPNIKLRCYSATSSPVSAAALCSPAPGHQSERTTSQSQLLLVTAPIDGAESGGEVAIFAIEVYIYKTKTLTTIFVSKADSTGYTSLIDLSDKRISVLRPLAASFVSYLVRINRKANKRVVLSLFARAQDQYLFPGSVENPGKHVLDDRGLVKWWCRTLDPVLREYPDEEDDGTVTRDHGNTTGSKAYLIVPGHDKYETQAFFPFSTRTDPAQSKRWINGHPLQQIALISTAPPRCLIPHFPDDPKSRFLMDLDEELRDVPSGQASNQASPSKRGKGQWKSVKTLEQFWEMMAHRQECCSGRLVGFLWIVFTPRDLTTEDDPLPESFAERLKSAKSSTDKPIKKLLRKKMKRVNLINRSGPVITRQPKVKAASVRPASAGQESRQLNENQENVTLNAKQYSRVNEMLLRLDFASIDVARRSTSKWLSETAVIAGVHGCDWGMDIVGTRELDSAASNMRGEKRKREARDLDFGIDGSVDSGPTTLNASLIRKRPKVTAPMQAGLSVAESMPAVNNLTSNLVRKKVKV